MKTQAKKRDFFTSFNEVIASCSEVSVSIILIGNYIKMQNNKFKTKSFFLGR